MSAVTGSRIATIASFLVSILLNVAVSILPHHGQTTGEISDRGPAYGLVIVSAYAGIIVEESAVLPVALVAGVGAAWIGVLVARTLVLRGRGLTAEQGAR